MARDGITKNTSDRTGKVSYRARVSFMGDDGQRQHRSKTFRTRKAAEKWRRDTLVQLDQGTWFEPEPVTVAEVAAKWLATVKRGKAPSTYRQYRHTWEHVVKGQFGHRRIASIRATEIQSFYDELGTRYRANTVSMASRVIRGIFGHALTDDLVRTNPADGRRLPQDQRQPVTVWTPEEVQRVMAHAANDDAAILFIVMLGTGMRLGETLGLCWDMVDLDARTLRVERIVQVTDEGLVLADTTKTASSRRTIALPSIVVMALRRQHALTGTQSLVFPNTRGRVQNATTVRNRLQALCDAAGVRRATPHDLRRTAATLLLRQGVNPKVAAQQLGHSVELMLRLYVEVSADMQADAADAIDDAMRLRLTRATTS